MMKIKKIMMTGALVSAIAGTALPITAFAQYDPVETGEVQEEEVLVEEPDDTEKNPVVIDYGDPILDYTKIESEASDPLTPDGNLTLVDDVGTSSGVGKQFITLVTKNGNYFYLIIDRDDKGEENVHFLNLVDEKDLLALMDEDEVSAYQEALAAQKEEEDPDEQEETTEENDGEEEQETAESQKKGKPVAALGLGVALLAAGGFVLSGKLKKEKKEEVTTDPDADYDEEFDEVEFPDEQEEESYDDEYEGVEEDE